MLMVTWSSRETVHSLPLWRAGRCERREKVSVNCQQVRSRNAKALGKLVTTLIEVLVAIFVSGVGLLALLTLFPLGALELARAVQDERTAAIAEDARELSDAGQQLLSSTATFVEDSFLQGSVDTAEAARLREEYDTLAAQASSIEARLEELQLLLPPNEIGRHAGRLLAQIRAIRVSIGRVIVLLSLADD